MNVVVWARVSSREQKEGYSIDAQLRACRAKAAREGWQVAHEFAVAESAKRGAARAECVCQEGDEYFILDGYIRYTALLELGIEAAPCLVIPSRDLYTPNRQVNQLSAKQEVHLLTVTARPSFTNSNCSMAAPIEACHGNPFFALATNRETVGRYVNLARREAEAPDDTPAAPSVDGGRYSPSASATCGVHAAASP
jgi:hypothetical protein